VIKEASAEKLIGAIVKRTVEREIDLEMVRFELDQARSIEIDQKYLEKIKVDLTVVKRRLRLLKGDKVTH
jgi:hypothetical protein